MKIETGSENKLRTQRSGLPKPSALNLKRSSPKYLPPIYEIPALCGFRAVALHVVLTTRGRLHASLKGMKKGSGFIVSRGLSCF